MYAHEPEIKIENCYLDILKIIAFSVVNTHITHNTTLGQNSCLCSIHIIWLKRSTLLICTRLTRHSKTDLILQKIFQTNSVMKIHTQEEKVVFFHDVHDHVIWVPKKDNVYAVCWLFSIWPLSLSFTLHSLHHVWRLISDVSITQDSLPSGFRLFGANGRNWQEVGEWREEMVLCSYLAVVSERSQYSEATEPLRQPVLPFHLLAPSDQHAVTASSVLGAQHAFLVPLLIATSYRQVLH